MHIPRLRHNKGGSKNNERSDSMAWTHFEYDEGNPYIAFTEKEKQRILRKYRRRGISVTELKPGFYRINNRAMRKVVP